MVNKILQSKSLFFYLLFKIIKIKIKIKIIYIVKGICFSNFLSNVPTR